MTQVRYEIFVNFIFEPEHADRLTVQVYYGVTRKELEAFRDEKGEFCTATFLSFVRDHAPAWMDAGAPEELLPRVIDRITKTSLGDDVPKWNEDVRLLHVAFHQINLKKQALKRNFISAYTNKFDGMVERLQAKQRHQELRRSLDQAARTGYFREIAVGGVGVEHTIQLWLKPLAIWFVDEEEEVQWSVDLDSEDLLIETPLEGPPV